MLQKNVKYSYGDISIIPCTISKISSRSECNPYLPSGYLPIFTAPMDSVVGISNYEEFLKNKIIPILPRTVDLDTRLKLSAQNIWCAYSLREFRENFLEKDNTGYVLIDIANGHMEQLFSLVTEAKKKLRSSLTVMIGNIANPHTYLEVAKCGADYVRLGIGSGGGCITSSNVSVHYPMASLIDETRMTRRLFIGEGKGPKIIADGGIRNYSDVIKALALGADYVMIGSLFSRMIESSGNKYFGEDLSKPFNVEDYISDSLEYDWTLKTWSGLHTHDYNYKNLPESAWKRQELGRIMVKFYGMASRDGQIALNGSKSKTSEGITKYLPVEFTLRGWTSNMTDYLRSAMSYTGFREIQDFIDSCDTIICSQNTGNSINK